MSDNTQLAKRRCPGPHLLIVQIGDVRYSNEDEAPLLEIPEGGSHRLGRVNTTTHLRPVIDLTLHLQVLPELRERTNIIQPTQAWIDNRDTDGVWLRTGPEDSRSMHTRPSGGKMTTPHPKNGDYFRLADRMLIYIGNPHRDKPFIMLRFIP